MSTKSDIEQFQASAKTGAELRRFAIGRDAIDKAASALAPFALPMYIAAIESTTGALVYRLSFTAHKSLERLADAQARLVRDCERMATRDKRAASYRIFETRDATFVEIREHFKRLENAGAIDAAERAERCHKWAARFIALGLEV